jgi:hypothetical protein
MRRPENLKARDKFIIVTLDNPSSNQKIGDVIELYHDDGTVCPKFTFSDGEQHFFNFNCLEPYIEPVKEPCLSDATKKLINKEIDKRIAEMRQSIPALVLAGMAKQSAPQQDKPFEVGDEVEFVVPESHGGNPHVLGKQGEITQIDGSGIPYFVQMKSDWTWAISSDIKLIRKVPQPTKHDKLTLHNTVAEMIKGNQGLIPAIRYYREEVGCGLLEAKIYVDKISAEIQPAALEVFIGGVKYVKEELK